MKIVVYLALSFGMFESVAVGGMYIDDEQIVAREESFQAAAQ